MPNLLRAYRNKVTYKLSGVVHMPARGMRRGNALVSYLTIPFTTTLGESPTDPHSSYWECAEIVRLLNVRGYAVDIIQFDNNQFVPKKEYSLFIDIKWNIERLAPYLPHTIKIMHIVSSNPSFQNDAEQKRLRYLNERRDVSLDHKRHERPSNNVAYADYIEGFGNTAVRSTYGSFGKAVIPIPISSSALFPFPVDKDFERARTQFIFFSGGGALLKGLDLVIEVFATLPKLTLSIIGPAGFEKEIESIYADELALPNIHRFPRPKIAADGKMYIDGKTFMDVMNSGAAILYPSASEGTSGAVVQAMHASLIPLITPETGIREDAPVTLLENPTVESIRAAVLEFSETPAIDLKSRALASWDFARRTYTREEFSRSYASFLDSLPTA